MIIESGTVGMESGRFYAQEMRVTQETKMTNKDTGATSYTSNSFIQSYFQFSGAGSSVASKQYDEYVSSMKEQNATVLTSDLYTNLANNNVSIETAKSALEKFHEELIERLEELMERIKQQLLGLCKENSHYDQGGVLDISTSSQPGNLWTRQHYEKVSVTETETTTFDTTGSVVTADGRKIDFNLSLEMSRSFTEQVETLSTDTEYILTDPLVIQLEDAPETISDQTWKFDLDCDGVEEEMSRLAQGNAFIALDGNDNGKIDDGSELFGARTGNGFAELSAYDEDGNGWIDENDKVYSKLKIWTKDAAGNDKLMNLAQADVGAIYLGAASTNFSVTDGMTNDVKAVIRQSGFYLRESTGAAGLVQQIDFATKEAV